MRILLTILLVLLSSNLWGQTGYYRSVVSPTGDWSNTSSWEYSADNTLFAAITTEGYPGELGTPTSVLIRDGDTITLDVSPANSLTALTVGEGTSGTLSFGNDATIRALVTTATVTINANALVNTGGNALHTLSIGDDLVVNGTLTAFNSATQSINISFTGTTSEISGSGTITFNDVDFNHTGTTTISSGFTVNNEFSISNTGTVNLGTNTLTSSGASNTFTMTSGEFQIGGTSTFPSGFETITLSGGTVHYNGLAQVIAHQESDAGTLVYNNVKLSESAGGNNAKTFSGGVDINGGLTLGANVDLNLGSFSHTVAGSWIHEGNIAYTIGTSTVTLDGSGFQSISNPVTGDDIEFYNLNVTSGGILSINTGSDVQVNNNMTVTGNTSITSASNVWVRGNFSVAAGSNLTHTAGTLEFDGTGAQNVDVSNTTLINLYFDNGSPTQKTVSGNASVTGTFYVTNDASITDAGIGQSHMITNLRLDGLANFQGTLTLEGTLYDRNDNIINLGTADVTIQNTANIENGDAVTVGGDFTIVDQTFTIGNGSSLTGTGNTFELQAGARLDIDATDGFPTGFATTTLSSSSIVSYTLNGVQTVRGNLSYGELELGGGNTKTVDGAVTISTYLDLNNGVTADFGAYTHTIRDRIYNAQSATFESTGTINFFLGDGANYEFIDQGTYTFNNVNIDTDSQTGSYIFDINADLTIDGNLDIQNSGGSSINIASIDFNDYEFTNDGGDTFTLGQYVELRTSGSTNFPTSVASFNSLSINTNSTIHYNGAVAQTITTTVSPYGNLHLSGNGNKNPGGSLVVNGELRDRGNGYLLNLGGLTHQFNGDFIFDDANVDIGTSIVQFNGTNQLIQDVGGGQLQFFNVTFGGSGTKTLDDNYNIDGDVTINVGVTVDASSNDVDIFLAGDWTDNGTFTQTTGEFYFNGTGGDQDVSSNSSSSFGQLYVEKASGVRSVTMMTDIYINRDVIVRANNILNTGTNDIYIGEDLLIETGGTWNQPTTSTLYMNGTSLQQFNNQEPTTTYGNIVIRNSGTKRVDNNALDINGNLTIESGSAFNSQNFTITVAGNWTNDGSFIQTGAVDFDGTNQTINASAFNRIILSNSGTKTLGGGITVTDDVTINGGVTLDVSASNYPITIGDDFTITGTFNARSGTLTFNGNNGVFTTNGATFHDISFNKNAGQRIDLVGNLIVAGDMNIPTGELELDGNTLTVAGDLVVSSGALLDVNNNASSITFNGTSGTHSIQLSGSTVHEIIINAPGATYNLIDDMSMDANFNFTLTDGTFSLNSQTLILQGTGALTINGGTFDVDDNATLQVPDNSTITNAGGIFRVVGLAGNPATITRSGGSGGYQITQSSGTFHAQYYEFLNTESNGITISGGTVDATDNFSNGTFSAGTGTQYLDLTGISITTTAADVIFGAGPTYNVTRTSGTGTITFSDATGTLAGEAFDNDGSTLVSWTFPAGVFWDGGGDGSTWSDDLNWSGNSKPTSASNVQLNHDFVAASYSVNINAEDAEANRLVINTGGGNPISLTVTGGFDLTVGTNAQVGTGGTLTLNNASSIISVAEAVEFTGTFTHTAGTFRLNGSAGSHQIDFGGNSVYDFEMDANGATYTLASALDINNDITLTDGTLDVSSNNYAITVNGNWSNVGLSTFVARNGTVTFDQGGTATQTISGGPFYNLTTTNGTAIGTNTKQLTGNVDVNNDLIISANTILDAQTNNLFVGGNWTNNASTSGFSQTGIGTVTFDDTGNQTIDNGSFATTFNNVTISTGGTATLGQSTSVNGDVQVSTGVGTLNLDTFTLTGNGGSNTFTISGGSRLDLLANNFPSTFETINLASNSLVDYRSNSNQDIFATTYGNLRLRRTNGGNLQTKTALGDLVVQGSLTINDTDTEFNLNGHTLTITGNIAFPAGGRNIQWGSATVEQLNTNDFNFDADITEWPTLILGGSGSKDLAANINVTGDVTVQNGVQLRLFEYTLTATGAGTQNFVVDNGATLRVDIPATTGVAYPTGFDSYSMGVTSIMQLYDADPQTMFSGVTYGEVIFANASTVTANGNLDIDGDFDANNVTLIDGGFNINIAGADVELNNYTASGTSILTLDGTTQTLRETSTNIMTLNEIVFAGSGTKTFGDGGDDIDVNGNLTVNSSVTVTSGSDINFGGATFTDNGTFTHTANILTFDRTGAQTIAAGTNTAFDYVVLSGNSTKTITTNGIDFNDGLNITAGSTLDLGSLTHNFGYNGSNLVLGGTLTSANANIILDGPNPNLPAGFTVNDLTISTTGDVDMEGNLDVNGNLTINSQLDVNNAAYALNIGGNLVNNGTFNDSNGSVTFDGSGGAVTVTTNGSSFRDVNFSPSGASTYTLTSPTNLIEESLTVGSNATLDLNSTKLTLGSNIGAGKTATIDGTLQIDDSAVLEIDNNNTGYAITVNGALEIVGTSSNIATLTSINFNNTRRTALTISATGSIDARYYLIEYLDNNGLVLTNGATVDATNNFSDGAWAGMVTATGGPYYYLQTNSVAIGGTIQDVSFSFGATPTPGTHYNVERDAAAGTGITFGGSISGSLGGEAYEDDSGNRITWPIPSTATWTGNFNTDWHQAANWSTLSVPIATTDVTIPLVTNNPIISTSDVEVDDLSITDGALTLSGGFDLTVNGNIDIGTGANSGALLVTSTTSDIAVAGNWTRGTNGLFTNGGATVTFNAAAGSVNIYPRNSAFNNVVINGAASTFILTGADFDIDGNLTVSSGTLDPATNNYTYTFAGDVNMTGGSFDVNTNGTITLDGANQSITASTFDNLAVSGTNTKTFNGNIVINDVLTVNSTLSTAVSSVLDINDDVIINSGGTFNNAGGGTHTVEDDWTNSGTYSGTGVINFDGGGQTINGSGFAGVEFSNGGVKTLGGNLTLTGSLVIRDAVTRLEMETYTITHTGSGSMTVEPTIIYVEGADNFPSGFATYSLDEASQVDYRSTSSQTIRGGVAYGDLILRNANTKSLGGNIIVKRDLYFNDATLDVTTNNYSINIGDDWFNAGTGSFIARLGDVIFDGDGSNGDQNIQSSLSGTKDFYKLTVNKTGGEVQFDNQAPTILDNIVISSGQLNPNNFIVTVGGSFDNSGGTFTERGTINFTSTSGSEIIRSNGSTFNSVTINGSGTTFTVQDQFDLDGNFQLLAGTFDGNGQTVQLGDNAADILTIDGTYIVGANGRLELGNDVQFTVNSSGTMYVVGTAGNSATVTRNGGGDYAFQVNGTIHANYYVFEYMDANGIVINNSATIDATNNFSNGAFTNGVGGGTFLRIENTQSLTMDLVSFPTNPGGVSSNVTKVVATSGTLTFTNASGIFAGEVYDDDPNNLINWPTPIVLTWIGGTSSDWYTATNWSASSGPNIVPTGAENVVINSATNQPIINTAGALANNITISSGAILTVNTANEAGNDFQVNGNITIDGTLTATSASDTILVANSFTVGNSGVYNNGNGTVIINGNSGANSITPRNNAFYNLIINATSSYTLGSNIEVENDFNITSGTLDVSNSNYSITVGRNWTNTGTFNPRNGTVALNEAAASTVTINNGTSSFNNLTINGGGSTTFQLDTNNLTVNGNLDLTNSTLDLNSLNLTLGDGAGSDIHNISGTLEVDANAQLLLGASSLVQVQSGGTFSAVGSDASNIATVTRASSGTYDFTVASGGTIAARYYSFGYMGANGIQLASGANINGTNNFSDGTFTNGPSGGRYIQILGISSDITVSNVVFNSGPSVNVRGTTGSGNFITFEDATGLFSGPTYEDDDGSATTGAIRWTSTSTQYTWTGTTSSEWQTLTNWFDGTGAPPTPPTAATDVIIPNVGTNDPIISTADANGNNITIQVGGNLTINSGQDLTLAGSFTNGGTFTIADGSTSTLSVGNNYSNAGTVTLGNQSTLELTAATGVKSLSFGGSALNNLTLNGAATFNLTSDLDVNGNLTITQGTLDVTTNNYTITVAGNWTNAATFSARSGRVTFDGTGAQSISGGGLTSAKRFYNLRINKSNTATLTSDAYVTNNLELVSGTFNLDSYTLEVVRAWTNTNVTVTPGTSTVVLSGANSILLGANSQSFNNLTINKTGSNQVSLSSNASVNGTLTITAGTLLLNGRTLLYGDGADAMSIDGTLYVDAGSILGMHQNSSATVNASGTMRVTGASTSNVATVTRRASTAGWNMTINGTLQSRYAVFEYSGGNGITLGASGSLHATENLSNTVFRNGTGTSYLTLNANRTTTITDPEFTSGPTYNISATNGAYTINGFSGNRAGARFENDSGPTHPGYVIWNFERSLPTPGTGSFDFSNDVVVNITANSGLTNLEIDYEDDLYEGDYNAIPRYFRFVYTGTTATADITFAYSDGELTTAGIGDENNLRVWVYRGNLEWFDLGGTVDAVNNTITISGYTLGQGAAQGGKGGNGPDVLLDGSEDFIISDESSESALPVELTRFELSKSSKSNNAIIEWETATETENYGYTLFRSFEPINFGDVLTPELTLQPSDTNWVEMQFIEGNGTTTEVSEYSYTDNEIQEAGKYIYRLTQIDFDGQESIYGPIEYLYLGPDEFNLNQNYPNPFNPTTTIPYDIAERTQVRVDVFNMLGQRVRTLTNEVQNPGSYMLTFEARELASGVYVIRMVTNGKIYIKKMVLVK